MTARAWYAAGAGLVLLVLAIALAWGASGHRWKLRLEGELRVRDSLIQVAQDSVVAAHRRAVQAETAAATLAAVARASGDSVRQLHAALARRTDTVWLRDTLRPGQFVPMPLADHPAVAALDRSCTRQAHDCTAALAAKDTALQARAAELAAVHAHETQLGSKISDLNQVIAADAREKWGIRARWGGGGFVGGFGAGLAACQLTRPP